MASATRRRVPALIVGGGPVGLYASSLLSAYGMPSLLAERSSHGAAHPRAHLINTRSMELLRELGIERAIREQTPPLDEWRHFRYCTSVLGSQIAAQDHMGGREWAALSEASASPMAHLSQPKLEALLKSEAERRAPDGGGELLFGYECVRFEQHADGVTAELRRVADAADAAGGRADQPEENRPEELTVEADYLVACDGAHSRVRRALGLRLRGPPPLQHFKSVHFVAPALAPLLREQGREAMLYFCFNRGAVAVLVAHNIAQGEWVAQLPFFPGLQDADALDRDACTRGIAACLGAAAGGSRDDAHGGVRDGAVGVGDAHGGGRGDGATAPVEFEVKSIGSWAMSSKVLHRLSLARSLLPSCSGAPCPSPIPAGCTWSLSHSQVLERLSLGRVHALGDAAHQFPPAGAFGANTGLQDAHNLCWKLAAVHHGLAHPKLARTYDEERRPVALANARLAVHNYHRGLRVAHALGLPSELPHTVASVLGKLRATAEVPAVPAAAAAAASTAAAASSAAASAASAASTSPARPPDLAAGLAAALLRASAGALQVGLSAAGHAAASTSVPGAAVLGNGLGASFGAAG